MDIRLGLIEGVAFSVVFVEKRPIMIVVLQIGVREEAIEVLLRVDAFSVIFAVPERTFVFITIDVAYDTKDEMTVEDAHFSGFRSVSDSLPFSSSSLKLTLVDLMLEDLSTMEMLESVLKLPDVLRGVGDEHAITMQHVVFPFSDVLDAVAVLLLDCFKVLVLSFELAWYFLELIVRQCQLMVKLKIELLQPFVHLAD